MNRYISYTLLVLAVVFAAACSSSEDMIGSERAGSESTAPITILGSPASSVVNTGAQYGEYTASINVPGKWSIATSKGLANVYPSSGEGPTTALVQVGENWGAVRENVLMLTAQDATTRAGDANESNYKLSIVQSGNPELDSLSKVFSANKGAGYSYMPGGEYCDGTVIQLFNLVTLDSIQRAKGVRLISDVIYPTTSQEYVTSNSESGLTKALVLNASVGVNFGAVKDKKTGKEKGSGSGSGGFGVDKGHEEKSKNKFCLKRLKSTQFTREIQYMNIMVLLEQATTREDTIKLLSPGFYSVQKTFAKDIADAKGKTAKQYELCDKFLSEFGPCFISKASMGTVLDYQISVDSTALSDKLNVQVALEASFQTKIKGKDISGGGSLDIGVFNESKEVTEKTTATVKVRGGDVSQVCILVTGGVLADSDVTAWQNSCRPGLAVMVDMSLVPIYVLIFDAYAREVLMNYFSMKLKANS
jgi:hypothetical protein